MRSDSERMGAKKREKDLKPVGKKNGRSFWRSTGSLVLPPPLLPQLRLRIQKGGCKEISTSLDKQ